VFERFTDRARAVLAVAQAEANAMDHNFLGTEHLLLGLLQGEGVAARILQAEGLDLVEVRSAVRDRIGPGPHRVVDDAEALASIGIDLDQVRTAVEDSFGEGALERPIGPNRRKKLPWSGPTFAPRAKKVLELSLREALTLKHSYIGTEHLLLAIVREGEGVAAQLLAERTDPSTLRDKVLDELRRLRPGA
jgi:ATP-dependent Clp protease ATP-binding subunit ClpA